MTDPDLGRDPAVNARIERTVDKRDVKADAGRETGGPQLSKAMPKGSETPPSPAPQSDGVSALRGWRKYGKWVVGVLAAFGILGAIGGKAVDSIWPNVEETIAGGGDVGINVREDPQGGSDGFEVAAKSPVGLDREFKGATDCDSLFTAAKDAGAMDVERSIHDLLLEGRTHNDLSIVDMRARILFAWPPARWRQRYLPLGRGSKRHWHLL